MDHVHIHIQRHLAQNQRSVSTNARLAHAFGSGARRVRTTFKDIQGRVQANGPKPGRGCPEHRRGPKHPSQPKHVRFVPGVHSRFPPCSARAAQGSTLHILHFLDSHSRLIPGRRLLAAGSCMIFPKADRLVLSRTNPCMGRYRFEIHGQFFCFFLVI